ncbi:hypothetical protein Bca101_020611 [Brassica carinata]
MRSPRVPSVVRPNHTRELEAFGYGFAALRDELYVIGGKVLKWEDSGAGRFDIVRLPVVRACNPLDRPLNWRETKPMCIPAGGSNAGCLSYPWKNISSLTKCGPVLREPDLGPVNYQSGSVWRKYSAQRTGHLEQLLTLSMFRMSCYEMTLQERLLVDSQAMRYLVLEWNLDLCASEISQVT